MAIRPSLPHCRRVLYARTTAVLTAVFDCYLPVMPASTLVEDHTKAVETKDAKTANDAMEVELMEVPSLGP